MSADHGGAWTAAGLQAHGITALRVFGGALYAGTFDGQAWRSPDNGASWTPLGGSFAPDAVNDVQRVGTLLYAAVNGRGVYRMPEGGSTWTPVNGGLPEPNPMCLAESGGELLVGLQSSGVCRLNGTGDGWLPSGLEHNTVFCLTPTGDGAELLAGTWGHLARSVDGGQTWTDDSTGLKPWLAIKSITAGNGWLYAGLEGGGVWRLPGGASAVNLEPPPPPRLALAVEPNPFTPHATVRFSLERPGPVELEVLDVSGRQVATLLADTLPAGDHQLSWTGRDAYGAPVASGLYFVRLRSSGGERVSRVMRVK